MTKKSDKYIILTLLALFIILNLYLILETNKFINVMIASGILIGCLLLYQGLGRKKKLTSDQLTNIYSVQNKSMR